MRLRATRLISYGRGRPAWTPSLIQTALWLDAADTNTITLNGSTVSQWNDKSGNGRNAVQATASNQPGWGVGRNLLQYSEEFNNAFWTKRGTVAITPNDTTAPDGTLTADRLSGLNTTTNDVFNSNYLSFIMGTPGASYTPSIYVKRISTTGTFSIGNTVNDNLYGRWTVDLAQLPDAWVRITANTTGVTVNVPFVFDPTGYGGMLLRGVTGGALSMHIWGAQINPGTTADPYQQTTSAGQTLSTGLNGKATMAWPDALNNRFMETSASFATQDVFVVARYRDGTQSSWLAAYQGVFGGAGTEPYIGLIGDTPDKWYTFCDFGQLRRNGGAAQTVSTGVTALPLPPALLNANRPAGAITASFCVGNDRTLALNRGWSGIMGEIIVLSSIASTETRQLIEGYLAWKWGGF